MEKNKKLTLKQVKNILINEMPFIDATDKIWEQYSKVMCKWLSAATMVNMDKNNTISTNNLGREIGDFLSDEIFFPTTMLAQIIKVVELLADNKEGMTIQELKKSMKRSSLNGHLIDACFLGLVRPISRSEYEITQNGLEFLGKEPNEKRGKRVLDDFAEGKIGEIYLAYTHFKNTVSQEAQLIRMLPVEVSEPSEEKSSREILMNYEPNEQEALNQIIPKYVTSLFYGALVEAVASENGARMQAMDSATSNAEEMIEDLSLKYNRARQGSITQELTEIIAGANAIE